MFLTTKLCFLIFFENVFHHEGKILRAGPYGTTAVIFQGHIAGAQNPLGALLAGSFTPDIVDELRDVDFHRTDIDAALTHGAHPGPVRL